MQGFGPQPGHDDKRLKRMVDVGREGYIYMYIYSISLTGAFVGF